MKRPINDLVKDYDSIINTNESDLASILLRDLGDTKQCVVASLQETQRLLNKIKVKFKSLGGARMERQEYLSTIKRQSELQNAYNKGMSECSTITNMIRGIVNTFQMFNDKKEISTPQVEKKDQILALIKKYSEFASDGTRISSMRLMASQFTDELRSIFPQ
jgi:hypothetical protein